jgi:uncharacterized protein YwqG
MRLTSQELIERLEPWRERWKRTAWKPITQDGESTLSASKFAGTPWLALDEPWPVCPQCLIAMPLFVQLNLASLPPALTTTFGTGLLQLFYCTQCDDAWAPFAQSSLVRIVQPSGASAPLLPPAGSFPAKTIIDWQAFDDFPNVQDHRQLGLDYQYDFGTPLRTTVTCAELGLAVEVIDDDYLAESISSASPGDKLAGWPHWIQAAEYPACPRCEQQMELVFQLDSEDHLPFMFGDVGTGHITQCSEHKDVVAFGWACS